MTKDFYLMTSAEVCKIFEIKPSTLRKWAVLLKNAGHEFHQDDHGRRHYRDSDVAILHRFVSLKGRGDMSLSKVAEVVVNEYKKGQNEGDSVALPATEVLADNNRHSNRDETATEIAQLKTLVIELINKVDNQTAEIHELKAQNERLIELQASAPADQEEDSADIAEEVAEEAPVKRSWWERLTGK